MIFSVAALEVASPRSKCRQSWLLPRQVCPASDGCLLAVPSRGLSSVYASVRLCIRLRLSVCDSVCLHLSVPPSVCAPICPCIFLSVRPSAHTFSASNFPFLFQLSWIQARPDAHL